MKIVISFLKKFWIPLAVIALYFLLAGLDFLPGGINLFRKKKVVIDNTPVIVKEIKDLGELSTSEFYGEVYADMNEVYEELITNFRDSIALNPKTYYKNYSGLSDFDSKLKNFQTKETEYLAEKKKFEDFLADRKIKLQEFTVKQKKLNDAIAALSDDRKEKRNLKNQLDDLVKKMDENTALLSEMQRKYNDTEFNYKNQKQEFLKFKKERNLVYIGRGWVKAGIDLKQLTEKNIDIESGDSMSIRILIPDPEILDADINHWFIYTDDKKVKGFEVFIAKTGSMFSDKNFTDYEVSQLKLKCKEKLKEAALEKGLMKNAKISTVKALENFFRILGYAKVIVEFKGSSIVQKS
jgi:hypothetical protein